MNIQKHDKHSLYGKHSLFSSSALPSSTTPSFQAPPQSLSNHGLLARVRVRCRQECENLAGLLGDLCEIHRRRLYFEQNYAGLYDYLHRGLGHSNGAAGPRMHAIYLIELVPRAQQLLARGELTLTVASALHGAWAKWEKVRKTHGAGRALGGQGVRNVLGGPRVRGAEARGPATLPSLDLNAAICAVSGKRSEEGKKIIKDITEQLMGLLSCAPAVAPSSNPAVNPSSNPSMSSLSASASASAPASASASSFSSLPPSPSQTKEQLSLLETPTAPEGRTTEMGIDMETDMGATPTCEERVVSEQAYATPSLAGRSEVCSEPRGPARPSSKGKTFCARGPDHHEVKLVLSNEAIRMLERLRLIKGKSFAGVVELALARLNAKASTKASTKPNAKQSVRPKDEFECKGKTSSSDELKRKGKASPKSPKKKGPKGQTSSGISEIKEGILKHPQRANISRCQRADLYDRSAGECQAEGCREFVNLEIDHITAVARGGSNAPENLRLLCPAHNRLWAIQTFGAEHMAQFLNPLKRGLGPGQGPRQGKAKNDDTKNDRGDRGDRGEDKEGAKDKDRDRDRENAALIRTPRTNQRVEKRSREFPKYMNHKSHT